MGSLSTCYDRLLALQGKGVNLPEIKIKERVMSKKRCVTPWQKELRSMRIQAKQQRNDARRTAFIVYAVERLRECGVVVPHNADRLEIAQKLADSGLIDLPRKGVTKRNATTLIGNFFRANGQTAVIPPELLTTKSELKQLAAKALASQGQPKNYLEMLKALPKREPKPKKKTYQQQSRDFLDSWEWAELRYDVLREHGRRCMCCGATPNDGVTVICVDHIKPRFTHPELALERSNLQVLCAACNQGKGKRDKTDYRGLYVVKS